jgi:transcriptional regulator of heat shock response
MTDRQIKILKKIVSLYVREAQPVSSSSINIDFCSATIRNEMQRLTEEGYLIQPHTSAGRIPSDKAYRFFVDISQQREEEVPISQEKDLVKIFQQTSRVLAEMSSSLALLGLLEEQVFFKEGWEEIVDDPDFMDHHRMMGFLRWIKQIEDRADDFAGEMRVYIGNENPLPAGRDFALIISGCRPRRKRGVIAICGPKRMAYDRNLALIQSVINQLENHV